MAGYLAGVDNTEVGAVEKPDYLAFCKGFVNFRTSNKAVFEYDPEKIDRNNYYKLGQEMDLWLIPTAIITQNPNEMRATRTLYHGEIVGFLQNGSPVIEYDELGEKAHCYIENEIAFCCESSDGL
jgi:hypothetical protein